MLVSSLREFFASLPDRALYRSWAVDLVEKIKVLILTKDVRDIRYPFEAISYEGIFRFLLACGNALT